MSCRAMLRWFIALGVLALTLAMSAVVLAQEPSPQADAGANWLHFGYDTAHTGHNPLESTIAVTNVSRIRKLWDVRCTDADTSHDDFVLSPAIYGDTLFTTASRTAYYGHRLTAYNARTGAMLWEIAGENSFHASEPVVSEDGMVFYLSGYEPTYLWALDASTGNTRWKLSTGLEMGLQEHNQVTVDNSVGRIYFLETDAVGRYWQGEGALWAVDKANGSAAWLMDKAHGFYDFNGRYVLLQSGKLYAIIQVQDEAYPYNMQDRMARIDPVSPSIEVIYNKLKWGPDIMHYVMCGGMLVVGYEYPASQDEVVVGYNVLTSTVVWSQTTEIATGEFACNDAEGRVYLPTNPYLYGLEATTGAEVWKYSGFGAIHTPSLANGIIYFTSRTNMVAIDEDTRQQVFSYPLGRTSDGIAQVAIGNGMLAFSNGAYGTIGGDGTDCALYVLGLPDLTYMPVLVRSD